MQERRNSSALAMELRLSCIKPSISFIELWHCVIFRASVCSGVYCQ